MSLTQKALGLVHKYHEEGGIQHALMVGTSMRALARYFNEDEETWEVIGMLHDIDWDIAKREGDMKHTPERYKRLLKEIDLDDNLIESMLSHDESQGLEANTLTRKAIRACDELSGFIAAVAKVRPEKLSGIKAKSVTKKIKDKAFAAAVSREHLNYCETLLNIPLSDFLNNILLPELEKEKERFQL